MNSFKPGDRILCIGMFDGYGGKLNIGQIYTVMSPPVDAWSKNWICVVENNGSHVYEDHYFKKILIEYEDAAELV